MLYAKQETPDQNQKAYFWILKITLIIIPEKINSKHKQPVSVWCIEGQTYFISTSWHAFDPQWIEMKSI